MYNFTKTILSALQAWANKRVKLNTPDWNQNNSEGDGYIKNRPFYTTKESVEVVNANMSIEPDVGYGAISKDCYFIAGDKYLVNLNGTDYECVAWESWNYENVTLIGNGDIYGGEGRGDKVPFVCDSFKDGTCYLTVINPGDYTIKITHMRSEVHKIPLEYLPDNKPKLATTDEIGGFTVASNETILESNQLGRIGHNASGNAALEIYPYQDSFFENGVYADVQIMNYWSKERYIFYRDLSQIMIPGQKCVFGFGESTGNSVQINGQQGNVSFGNMWFLREVKINSNGVPYIDINQKIFDITHSGNGKRGCIYIDSLDVNGCLYFRIDPEDASVRNFVFKIPNAYLHWCYQIPNRSIPSNVLKISNAEPGQIVVVDSVDENGYPSTWGTTGINSPKDGITLIDHTNGYHYVACMRDGNFVTYCATEFIEVVTMPDKTEYVAGEYFDPAGMIVTATAYDGSSREITDYTFRSNYFTEEDTFVEIMYNDAGVTCTTSIPVTISPFDHTAALTDFEYTANADGTYTITAWKGTRNGETSTEIIVPNNGLIIV